MRNSLGSALAAIWPVFLVLACAGNTAPPGFLESPSELDTHAFGGWIQIAPADAQVPERAGELIAVTPETLYVLSSQALLRIPVTDIAGAKLTGYLAGTGLGAWTFFGTLSTLSHGVGLVISAPIWLIFGSSAAVSHSRAPVLNYPEDALNELAPYARFPQGLPTGIDLSQLKPKPQE